MLILTSTPGIAGEECDDEIIMGTDIVVRVLNIDCEHKTVSLGITAPDGTIIDRRKVRNMRMERIKRLLGDLLPDKP